MTPFHVADLVSPDAAGCHDFNGRVFGLPMSPRASGKKIEILRFIVSASGDSLNATRNRRLNPRAALKPRKRSHLPASSRGESGCASIGSWQACRHACC